MSITSCSPFLQELIDELGICIVTYDRAGYGDSDPNPKRSVKSEAFDVEELADQIQLGQKFYVLGVSLGTHPTWACLKFIPHRHVSSSLFYIWGKICLQSIMYDFASLFLFPKFQFFPSSPKKFNVCLDGLFSNQHFEICL